MARPERQFSLAPPPEVNDAYVLQIREQQRSMRNSPEPLMTLTDMRDAMNRQASAAHAALLRLENARTEFQQIDYGYESEETREKVRREHLPKLFAVENSIVEVANEVEALARRVLKQANAPRTLRLPSDPDHLSRVYQMESTVARQVEQLSFPQLERELVNAVATDDQAALYLFATLLPDRLDKPLSGKEARNPNAHEARKRIQSLLTHQVSHRFRDDLYENERGQALHLIGEAMKIRKEALSRRKAETPKRTFDGKPKISWNDNRGIAYVPPASS